MCLKRSKAKLSSALLLGQHLSIKRIRCKTNWRKKGNTREFSVAHFFFHIMFLRNKLTRSNTKCVIETIGWMERISSKTYLSLFLTQFSLFNLRKDLFCRRLKRRVEQVKKKKIWKRKKHWCSKLKLC